MNDDRYDNIEYNENWQSVPVVRAEPFVDEIYDEDDEQYFEYQYDEQNEDVNKPLRKNIIKSETPQPVIKLQLIIGVIIIAGAFLLKNFGGEVYDIAKQWYFENLNNSLVVTMETDK